MSLPTVKSLLDDAENGGCFPETLIYEEGWLLRSALALAQECGQLPVPSGHERWPFSFTARDRWYSEARLSSPFPRVSGGGAHQKPEGATHADAAIGDFEIGGSLAPQTPGSASLQAHSRLTIGETRLDIIEAKLGSPLSAGTKYAPTYNQAARNVACILWAVFKKPGLRDRPPELGFWVVAPRSMSHLEDNPRAYDFASALDPRRISSAIQERASVWRSALEFSAGHSWVMEIEEWLRFVDDTLHSGKPKVSIDFFPWEEVVESLAQAHSPRAADFSAFYERCKEKNGVS